MIDLTESIAQVIASVPTPEAAARIVWSLVKAQVSAAEERGRSSLILEQRAAWSSAKKMQRKKEALPPLGQKMSEDISGQKSVCIENKEESKNNTLFCPKTSQDITGAFAAFWALYPKKKSKADALRAWKRAAPRVGGETALLEAIRKSLSWQLASESWVKDGGRFVPYPASYLNAGGWDDEPEKQAKLPPRLVANPYRKA